MNKASLLALGLAFATNTFAQDIIITRDAKKLEAKVTELGVFVIKYKLANEVDGPTYVLPKNKIAAITYENGRVETYFDGNTMSSVSDSTSADSVVASQTVNAARTETIVAETNPVTSNSEASVELMPDNEMTETMSLLDYEEKVKGIRFKVEAAPLFGAHESYYGYERHGFEHRDRNVAFHDSTYSLKPGLNAAISVGYQFNPVIYLGAGFDVAALDKFDWVALSEYLDFNVYCLRYNMTSPTVGLRAGITSLVEPEDRMGYFIEPSVGVCHRFKNPKLALGFTIGYRVTAFDIDDSNKQYNGLYYDDNAVSSYFTKVSFSF